MVKFKNRKFRSEINFQILKTMFKSYSILTFAELCEISKNCRSTVTAFKALVNPRKSGLYIYLYRLAEAGFVKIEGLRRHKRFYLSPKGRRVIKILLKKEQLREKQLKQAPPKRTEIKITPNEKEDNAIAKAISWIKNKVSILQKRITTEDFMNMRERMSKEYNKGNMSAFISYDIPNEHQWERIFFSLKLRDMGFIKMNESMYVGETRLLKDAIELAEDLHILIYICWGKLVVMPA